MIPLWSSKFSFGLLKGNGRRQKHLRTCKDQYVARCICIQWIPRRIALNSVGVLFTVLQSLQIMRKFYSEMWTAKAALMKTISRWNRPVMHNLLQPGNYDNDNNLLQCKRKKKYFNIHPLVWSHWDDNTYKCLSVRSEGHASYLMYLISCFIMN